METALGTWQEARARDGAQGVVQRVGVRVEGERCVGRGRPMAVPKTDSEKSKVSSPEGKSQTRARVPCELALMESQTRVKLSTRASGGKAPTENPIDGAGGGCHDTDTGGVASVPTTELHSSVGVSTGARPQRRGIQRLIRAHAPAASPDYWRRLSPRARAASTRGAAHQATARF